MAVYEISSSGKKNFFSNLSATYQLIIFNVGFFILVSLLLLLEPTFFRYIFISRSSIESGYFWTFLTSMFMHGGIFHLFVNMFSLFFVGSFVEKLLGSKRYISFYLVAGFFSGILHVLFETVPAVGASGSLFGLVGILMFLTPNLPVYMMFIPIPVKMKYAAPGMLIFLWLFTIETGVPIGNLAHLGGLLSGVVYGIYLKKKFPRKSKYINKRFS